MNLLKVTLLLLFLFQVREIQYLAGIDPLTTNSTIEVICREVNDVPVLAVLERGYDITTTSSTVDLVIKQNLVNKTTTNHINILWAAFDVDAADDLKILTAPSSHGVLDVSRHVRDIRIVPGNCSKTWDERQAHWEQLELDLWTGTNPLDLPEPCNLVTKAPVPDAVEWAIKGGRYTPDDGFYGVDRILVSDLTDKKN